MRRLSLWVTIVFVVTVVLANSERARAACAVPSFTESNPRPPGTLNRPKMPSCVATQRLTGREACPKGVFKKYRDDANRYVRRLQTYVGNAQSFANRAIAFARGANAHARCEVDEMNNQ